MPEPFARLVHALVGIPKAMTAYVAMGLCFGSATGLFSHGLGLDPRTAFALGFFVPIGPLYLYYSSSWAVERQLRRIVRWREEGLIKPAEYDEIRKAILSWYKTRRLGS